MKEFSALTVDFASGKGGRGKGGLDSLSENQFFRPTLFTLHSITYTYILFLLVYNFNIPNHPHLELIGPPQSLLSDTRSQTNITRPVCFY